MQYRSMRDCANDLERSGQLIRIKEEVDPDLVMADIHRRVFDANGPAILYENVKGFTLSSHIEYIRHQRKG